MKKDILLIIFSISIIAICVYLLNDLKQTKSYIHLEKEKNNDSLLLLEYQKAYQIFLNENKDCALKFSKIMDSINCN